MTGNILAAVTAVLATFGAVTVWAYADAIAETVAELVIGFAEGLAAGAAWVADQVASLVDQVRSR